MKINKEYKYWQLQYEEDPEFEGQQIGSIWSDEWSSLEILNYSEEELRHHLLQDIEYFHEKVNKNSVRYAINELKNIKKELALLGVTAVVKKSD